MSKGKKKRKALFDRFSENLRHVKTGLGIEFTENSDKDLYLCPLTLKLHNQESLEDKYSDSLTIEHAPPESLGGKIIALTSKDVNNNAGSSLDIHLRRHIRQKEFQDGDGDIAAKFRFQNYSIKGRIVNDGSIKFLWFLVIFSG